MAENKVKKCKCAYCDDRAFEVPKDIIEAIKNENLVIFAGAGISTEGKNVYKCILKLIMNWGKIIIIHFLN